MSKWELARSAFQMSLLGLFYMTTFPRPHTHTHTTGAASLLPSGPIVVLFQLSALHVKHVGQVNTLRPWHNGRNFAHNIFKFFLLNENCCILILISLKFVPEGPIGSKWGLVKIIAWHRTGANYYMNQWSLHLLMHTYITPASVSKHITAHTKMATISNIYNTYI